MKKTADEMMRYLNRLKIKTWFDLGLFLDEFKENNIKLLFIVNVCSNPGNIDSIGTAVDTEEYKNPSKRIKINTFYQFEKILSRYKDTLISFSVKDVIKNRLVDKTNPRPILIGNKTRTESHFLAENIIFLQPTRIIERKRTHDYQNCRKHNKRYYPYREGRENCCRTG